MTRAELIAKGRLWTVHTHESITPEKTFFEGSKTACIKWLKDHAMFRAYKAGHDVRLGYILWEDE